MNHDDERPFFSDMLNEARTLTQSEVRRHALVSTSNRHRCRDCFTCACVVVLEERAKGTENGSRA